MPDSPDTSAAAIVRDHAFEPRTYPVTFMQAEKHGAGTMADLERIEVVLPPNEALCGICRLAEAAHIR
jgi:hypothetical protein